MPMSRNSFGVGTAPPPMPPHMPPHIPGYPPPRPGTPAAGRRRRWPLLVAAAVIGGVVASAASAVVVQGRTTAPMSPQPKAQATVTIPAPKPAAPAPLPTAQADRHTCQQGWVAAGNFTDQAVDSLRTLPDAVKVGDPAIRSNPDWMAAVQRAADAYRNAGDVLAANISPGTTPVLAEASRTAVQSLKLLAIALDSTDPAVGNAGEIVDAAGAQVGRLCQRLAP
jgi:hypothetical protein